MTQLAEIPATLAGVRHECDSLALAHNELAMDAEFNYATQMLFGNAFLLETARKNPVSLQNSLRNSSAIGISLNPALKHAYLVPRNKTVCLDISYMGLLHLAQSAGAIEFGQAKLVYKNDTYESQGIDLPPVHKYNAFGDRGDLVGVYCVVRTSAGAYLTEEMSKQQVDEVRKRSMAKSGPWFTDYEEMTRKTVVKRASKYWPKAERLSKAIDHLNTDGGEGFEQAKDVTARETPQDALNRLLQINDVDVLRNECRALDKTVFAAINQQVTAHANQLKQQAEVINEQDIPV